MSVESNRRWWTLAGCCTGLFLLMLDSTIVTLALPSMQRDLGASTAELQWVANGYLLTIGALVVTLGRLGDIRGRRPVFAWGLATFGAGAVLAALAADPALVIAGRFVQGIGGSSVLALSLAIASAAFPEAERPRALGIWAGVSAAALALGPLLGGVLVEAASWRWVFWSAVPFVLLGIALVHVAGGGDEERAEGRLDIPGVVTLTLGLSLGILALVQGPQWGWESPETTISAAAGVVALVAFWIVEHRVENPIVDFAIFHNGPYFGATAAAFALVGCWWPVIFYQPQYLQNVLGYSAIEAGFLILPVTLPMVFLSPGAGRLIKRFGARALMTFGMVSGVAGLVFLTRISGTADYGSILPGYLLFGLALSLVYAPMSAAAMAAMPDAKAGIAAGVLAMNRILAGALALAAVGAVYQHLEAEELAAMASRDDAASYALGSSAWILVALCAVGTVLTWAFVRDAPPPEPHDTHRHRRLHL